MKLQSIVPTVLLCFTMALPAVAEPSIQNVFDHYQVVRLALVDDRVDSVAAHALVEAVAALQAETEPSATTLSVEPSSFEIAAELLTEVHAGATALAAAGSDLAAARDGLYQMSKPLVRYRELMTGERPAVAYCPMAKKSWLQHNTDTIGNPYHGQSMPRCGSIVAE